MLKFKMIVFYGIDGSGKSTQAQILLSRLRDEGFLVHYVWARRVPVLTRIPANIIKKFIFREKGNSDGANYSSITKGRKKIFEHNFCRFVWTRVLLFEYLLFSLINLYFHHRKADYLVVDRYLLDALVDFASMSPNPFNEISHLEKSWIVNLFPYPWLSYLIDVPPTVGFDRKLDGTSLDYLTDRQPLYISAAQTYAKIYVIDGTKSVCDLAKDVWGILSIHRDKK